MESSKQRKENEEAERLARLAKMCAKSPIQNVPIFCRPCVN